jgi:hypothetical protein
VRGTRLPLLRCERVVDKRRDFRFQIAIRKRVAAAVSQGLELVHADSVASDAAFGSNDAQVSGFSPLEISASSSAASHNGVMGSSSGNASRAASGLDRVENVGPGRARTAADRQLGFSSSACPWPLVV